MARSALFQLALFFVFFHNPSQWTVRSQSLPPATLDGFVYENRHISADTILVEAFFDPVCPDSRDSWPPLKQALDYYGASVVLVLHLLPLPYHDNAYVASRALHVVNSLSSGTNATFELLEYFFEYQEKFYNAATLNMTRVEVVDEIIKFSAKAVGNLSTIESGFTDSSTDIKTRISFKYSASRGVYGTPFFYINGFLLPDADSLIDYNGWRSFIDPLIAAQSYKTEDSINLFSQ